LIVFSNPSSAPMLAPWPLLVTSDDMHSSEK
jgi:hypothetical protein